MMNRIKLDLSTHFHLYKIRVVAGFSAVQSMLNNGPKSGGYGCIQTGSPIILHLWCTSKGSKVCFYKTT